MSQSIKYDIIEARPIAGVVVWDNRYPMHPAINDYDGYRRCMCRTSTVDEMPIGPRGQ